MKWSGLDIAWLTTRMDIAPRWVIYLVPLQTPDSFPCPFQPSSLQTHMKETIASENEVEAHQLLDVSSCCIFPHLFPLFSFDHKCLDKLAPSPCPTPPLPKIPPILLPN